MKYKYQANCYIIDYERDKTMFKFDENGEFETEDLKLIDWIKKNKGFLKPIAGEAKQEPAGVKLLHCKKCDFSTDNNGILMAHYRTEHPKKKE